MPAPRSRVPKRVKRIRKQVEKYKARASAMSKYKSSSQYTKGSVTDLVTNTQYLNKGKEMVYFAKKTYSQNLIAGTGASVLALLQWNIGQFPDIGNYSLVFNKYRCYKLQYTFKLVNLEATDNAIIPEIYIRYNDDPDITTVSTTQLLGQRNVVRHQFTPSDLVVTYTVYPKKMMASQIYQSTTLQATPVKAGWEDVDKTIGHYGLQYIIPNLPTGMNIEVLLTASVGFKEQW